MAFLSPLVLLTLSACSGLDGPCPAYSGVGPAGTVRTYESVDAAPSPDAERSTTMETLSAGDDGAAVVRVSSFLEEAGQALTVVSEYSYQCEDEGMYLEQVDWSYASVEADSHESSAVQWTFSPPTLELPADVEPGDTWTEEVTQTITYSNGDDPSEMHYVQTTTVGEEESLDLPIGRTDALPFAYTYEFDGVDTSGAAISWYYHRRYGLVQNESIALASVE